MSTKTTTCASCNYAVRGPGSHLLGELHENSLCHTVWYDEDPHVTELEDWEGEWEDPELWC